MQNYRSRLVSKMEVSNQRTAFDLVNWLFDGNGDDDLAEGKGSIGKGEKSSSLLCSCLRFPTGSMNQMWTIEISLPPSTEAGLCRSLKVYRDCYWMVAEVYISFHCKWMNFLSSMVDKFENIHCSVTSTEIISVLWILGKIIHAIYIFFDPWLI